MRSEEAVAIVNKYHQLYIQHLVELYNLHKELYFRNRLSDLKLSRVAKDNMWQRSCPHLVSELPGQIEVTPEWR